MTREEAIDIIRKNIPHLGIGAAEMTDALTELIPELRESEDERIRQKLIHIVKKYRSMVLDGDDKVYDDCLAYLEDRKEPAPAEWSEEDEKMLDNMIKVLNCHIVISGDTRREFSKWLKSLRPQPKHEWTTYELNTFANCCLLIGAADDSFSKEFKDECIHFLMDLQDKSLLPSWKPNKEQMKALGASIVFHKDDPFVERLRELYNQLQKL